jgi:hypothetical protein
MRLMERLFLRRAGSYMAFTQQLEFRLAAQHDIFHR